MRLGVRGQLLLPVIVVVVGFVLVCVASAIEAVNRERLALSARLDEIARTLDTATFPLTSSVLNQMRGLTGAEFLVQSSDQVLTTLPNDPQSGDLKITNLNAADDGSLGAPIDWQGTSYFARIRRAPAGHPNVGATLAILYPVGRWNATAAAAVRPVLIFGLSGAVLAAGLTLAIGGRLVSRVRALESQTRRVADGDFAPVPLPTRDDEMRDLAASVNSMASRLHSLQNSLQESERWRLLGQVSSGIGHQLRNGVTGAKLALQLHARESGETPSEPMQVALRQLELLDVQVKRFLDLGRNPNAEITLCSLADVADEAIALVRPRCRHLGIELRLDRGGNLSAIRANRGMLLQMMLNLLGNSIDACGQGGAIEIRTFQSAGAVAAEFLDTGPGPADNVAGRLFDPFITAKPDGIGLGLTVVRRAAEAHGGTVSWERAEGRTCFRVLIPTADDKTNVPSTNLLA